MSKFSNEIQTHAHTLYILICGAAKIQITLNVVNSKITFEIRIYTERRKIDKFLRHQKMWWLKFYSLLSRTLSISLSLCAHTRTLQCGLSVESVWPCHFSCFRVCVCISSSSTAHCIGVSVCLQNNHWSFIFIYLFQIIDNRVADCSYCIYIFKYYTLPYTMTNELCVKPEKKNVH